MSNRSSPALSESDVVPQFPRDTECKPMIKISCVAHGIELPRGTVCVVREVSWSNLKQEWRYKLCVSQGPLTGEVYYGIPEDILVDASVPI